MLPKSCDVTRRRMLKTGAGGVLGLIAAPYVALSQALDPVKLSLEFRIYGGNAPMFLAQEKGIFKDLNLDVSADGSSGSGESVTRVASGTHNFGLADASTVIEFGARNPSVAPKLIMMVFDRFPAVVLSLKKNPINKLQDLVGKKLATGTADAGVKILPALLALHKIDPASINRLTIDVKLRDTMLMKGEVDAVIGFDYTTIFNLMEAGLKLEDINLLYYSDLGFDFPGNALITSPEMIQKNPDLVRRVATAVARGWVAGAKDREGAIAAVTKRDRLLKPATELARMNWVIDKLIQTSAVKENGIGHVSAERMTKGITVLKEGFQLASLPALDEVYDSRFLPPAADRKFS
ncbi:MAG TPA: ABC transporter substrate-binding protein [Xanthobacteraceae bacterium]|jgi:NitT/TauT family transport system substrate-binding protein